jgi:hypothetical protein
MRRMIHMFKEKGVCRQRLWDQIGGLSNGGFLAAATAGRHSDGRSRARANARGEPCVLYALVADRRCVRRGAGTTRSLARLRLRRRLRHQRGATPQDLGQGWPGHRAAGRVGNVERDFGAWRDALAVVLRDRPSPRELLLANDSVLGPIRPIAPVIAGLPAGGDGLFGLTENRGGGAHLQSYALLARGGVAVKDMAAQVASSQSSRSKWRLVQKGEIGLTRHMLARGHRVAALFGYDRLTGALRSDDLRPLGPRCAEPDAVERYPFNPTHHLSRVLIERFGFPLSQDRTGSARSGVGGAAPPSSCAVSPLGIG